MPDITHSEPARTTQLTAINTAKAVTIALLITLAIGFGVKDMRQVIYLCLHISYCLWWLLEQGIYPQRKQLFNKPISIMGFISILGFVGIFYTLPGYLAFTNPLPLSFIAVTIALPLYTFGSLINASADVQKMTAKQASIGLVSDGIWRFSRNINYFGDLLRYLSFAVISGSLWAYLVPGAIALLYIQRLTQKEQTMGEKYPGYTAYQQSSTRLIPFIW